MGRDSNLSADPLSEGPQSAPSAAEVSRYYVGLPSQPKLVARTGPKWGGGHDFWGHSKCLAPVKDDHVIIQYWEEGHPLPDKIFEAAKELPWVAIDILSVAEWDGMQMHPIEPFPVVLFITVEPGQVQWETGDAVARRCKAILVDDFKIEGVEVEIKESDHTKLGCEDVVSDTQDTQDTQGTQDSKKSPCLLDLDPKVFHDTGEFDTNHIRRRFLEPLRHLTDSIGTRFSPNENPSQYGTKGLYLRVEPTDPKQWPFEPCDVALTCRHVVFGKDDDGGVYRLDRNTPKVMSQNTGQSRIYEKLEKLRDNAEEEAGRLTAFFTRPDANDRPNAQKRLKDLASLAKRCAEVAGEMDKILKGANLQGLTIDVGHVLFAQRISLSPPPCSPPSPSSLSVSSLPSSPTLSTSLTHSTVMSDTAKGTSAAFSALPDDYTRGNWVRDYALVKMRKSVHQRGFANRLPISINQLEDRLKIYYPEEKLRNDSQDSFWEQSDDAHAILSAQIVPDDEIKTFQDLKKKEKNEDEDEDEAQMIVGKFGAATGLTFGTVNNVKSVTRWPTVIGRVTAWEICVVGPVLQPGINGGIPTYFSRGRDSGSAVWDQKGRVLGLLTSGLGEKGVPDTSYITSLDRIIRDLEAEGAKVTLF